MDSSLHEQEPGFQQDPKRFSFSVDLPTLASLFQWLAGFIKLTEQEQEEAGIYLDRLGGE